VGRVRRRRIADFAQPFQHGIHLGQFAELVQATGACLELAGRLRTAQQQQAQHGGLGIAQ
jgi:hypothetical protein